MRSQSSVAHESECSMRSEDITVERNSWEEWYVFMKWWVDQAEMRITNSVKNSEEVQARLADFHTEMFQKFSASEVEILQKCERAWLEKQMEMLTYGDQISDFHTEIIG